MRLKIATYNIHRCIGSDGKLNPERIAMVLAELDADVIALQEVESCRRGESGPLAELATATGMSAIYGPTMARRWHYGNAILTRGHVRQVRRHDLSHPFCEPRGALDVDLECNGVDVHLIATHLGLRPAERHFQSQRLIEFFRWKQWPRSVLMGDLNEWLLWGRPLRWLQGYFGETPAPRTFHARVPLLSLDRIWVHPRDRLVSLAVHRSPLARLASDHLPLVAVVDWGTPERTGAATEAATANAG